MTMPRDAAVFHICSRQALDAARAIGAYRAESLEHDGFIHLSRAHQVLPTARAYFSGVPDLVVLVIDPSLLQAPLVYEPPAPLPTEAPKTDAPGELYPHCYGPIDMAAIVDVMELAAFTGAPVHAETMALLRTYRFRRLPVEGTLYRETWRSEDASPEGTPYGTAMVGLLSDTLGSRSLFHRLAHDELWHAYAGDPFVVHLLHADGRVSDVVMGADVAAGQQVQLAIPAGTWQAARLLPGGTHALFGCTMAPGFSPACFEGGRVHDLTARYPAAASVIAALGVSGDEITMPSQLPI